MGRWVKKALAGLAALALLAAPAAAQVPDPFARELAQKLTQAETLLNELSYARAAGPFAGSLAQRESRRINVTLRAGQDYRVVGVCDYRCRDMDLRIFDPHERLAGQDTLGDAVPTVQVRPRFTGRHTIEVTMERCGVGECWYAVNVYSR